MALWGTQLTDQMMVDPTMFDPTQRSNQFSLFKNAALPYPPTYGGTPVSAATGQPSQSYQNWLMQNPAGVTLNQTPAASTAADPNMVRAGMLNDINSQIAQANAMPQMGWGRGQSGNYMGNVLPGLMQQRAGLMAQQYGPGATGTPAAAPQGGGPSGSPNNWNAALAALANPGTPAIGGATVPMATGSQPAGGVNAAWLAQAQGRPGMNQNFLRALRAIQGR